MDSKQFAAPYFPIIYVRGYAMTEKERAETSADPFCGFNLGATVFRAVADRDRPPRKFVFESPVLRLMAEHGYGDVYEDGADIQDLGWDTDALGQPTGNRMAARSIVVYRYYDNSSGLLGNEKVPTMEALAEGLAGLILRMRDLVCANPDAAVKPADFRCYLVAHSMGGLVCRALLQNRKLSTGGAVDLVDKFFTYATPHNGIDLGGINIPSFLSAFSLSNFDRDKRMPEYLGLPPAAKKLKRADLVPVSAFPIDRIFCMVGTNRADYDVALGLSRTFAGNGSDGLVRIENATLQAVNANGSLGARAPKAFTFRSHSGYYGIVNSEEGYQNLSRFLFGDVRADIFLDIDDVRLPKALVGAEGVDALYQIEMTAAPRGKLWYLSRRIAEEDSVACFSHAHWQEQREQYLSTVFLSKGQRMDKSSPAVHYSLTVGLRLPDYEVGGRLWRQEHYEGQYLYRETIVFEMTAPENDTQQWQVLFSRQGTGITVDKQVAELTPAADGRTMVLSLPFDSSPDNADGPRPTDQPAVKGNMRLLVSGWN
ncbi:hypothetical protein [Xylophilus sp. GOD-11R]|uniref:esterase/lipase family protein n=1 Tax=Xylophilus sp. GOD-11R TaxID=3089814 RepID=UPI00298CBA5B|nr:hypothetical protein [Xylophilus sp. GOD-11R]WPB59007.1 hypothetical protein R9X41_10355 [Xylophilus sp. GOD-11R]